MPASREIGEIFFPVDELCDGRGHHIAGADLGVDELDEDVVKRLAGHGDGEDTRLGARGEHEAADLPHVAVARQHRLALRVLDLRDQLALLPVALLPLLADHIGHRLQDLYARNAAPTWPFRCF